MPEAAVVQEPLYFLRYAQVVKELAERTALTVGPRKLLWIDGAECTDGLREMNHSVPGRGGRNTVQDFPCHCVLDHPSFDCSFFRGEVKVSVACLYMGDTRSHAEN